MADPLTTIASVVAGIGSLICFILVVVHLFKTEQSGLAIACLVLIFCGIGGLVAFVKGWMAFGRSCGSGRRASSWGCCQTMFFDRAGDVCSLPPTASPSP